MQLILKKRKKKEKKEKKSYKIGEVEEKNYIYSIFFLIEY